MSGPRTRERASAWRCAGRSSSTSAAGAGSTPASPRAPGSASPCLRTNQLRGPMADRDGGTLVDVLLVEDDEGDILMTREAFEFHKIRNPLHVVTDGEQALHFMRRTGPYVGAPRPGLILLDVNLPRLSGLEVLAELKQDPELAVLPVVMLTTSQAEEDILRDYNLPANGYVTKPVDFDNFIAAIRQIDDFFLTLVQLPSAGLAPRV